MHGLHIENHQYDALDNIRRRDFFNGTTTRTDTYTYDTANRLQSITSRGGVQTFGYGPRGNIAQRLNLTPVFNSANQRVSISNGYRFEYDGYGRRTVSWRPDGGGKMDVYDASGVVRYTSDGRLSGGITYLHLGGTLIGERFVRWDGTAEEIKYVHTDALGSPVLRTDRWGNVTERERFMAFGQPVDGSVRETLGFTGHMEDPALGLTYMQQRYYDPTIGRFLSVDPVGPMSDPIQHFGRYHYALNNPYRFSDPDGRQSVDDFGQKSSDCPGCVLTPITSDGKRAFIPHAVVANVVSVNHAGEESFADYETEGFYGLDAKEGSQLLGIASDVLTGITAIAPNPATGFAAGVTGAISLALDPSFEGAAMEVTGAIGGVVKGMDTVTGNAIEVGSVIGGNRENIQTVIKHEATPPPPAKPDERR